MEIRSINRGFAWQFASPQYCQPHDEWEKDMDNDEVEHAIPQHVELVFQTQYLKEQAFAIEMLY